MDLTLSPEALAYAEQEFLDHDGIKEMVANALEKPDNFFTLNPSTIYVTHAPAFAHPYHLGGAEYLLDAVNMELAYRTLKEKNPETTVTKSSFGHWTYSHFDCLNVELVTPHPDNQITLDAAILFQIAEELKDYPLVDGDDEALTNAESALGDKYFIEALDDLPLTDEEKLRHYQYVRESEYVTPLEAYSYTTEEWTPPQDYTPDTAYAPTWKELKDYAAQVDHHDIAGLIDGEYL